MALIALVATTTDDHNALQSTLDRLLTEHGLTSVLPSPTVPAPQASAPVSQPAPSAPAVDGAEIVALPSHVSGYRPLYAKLAHAAGLSDLSTDQRNAVKAILKGRPASITNLVKAIRNASQAVVPSVDVTPEPAAVDPIAAERARLMAEYEAKVNALDQRSQPTTAARPKLDAVPPVSQLRPDQVQALRTWADTFVMDIRKNAVLAYCDGRMSWADVLSTGVKTEKALRKLNKVNA